MSAPRIRVRRTALATALALGLLAAAGRAAAAEADLGPPRQQVEQGAVRVTLEADRRTMPIDGALRLTLTVEAPAGTVVTLPAVADRLGPFLVASGSAPAASSAGPGRERWRQDYVLEAEGAGELSLPQLVVTAREPDGPAARTLATAPVAIAVTSLLPAEVDFTAYKDIAPPVELPHAGPRWLVWPAALLTLALAALALLLWRRRRRSRPAAPRAEFPHLVALAELERLERRLPGDRPATEEFYVRLAQIVRHYVAQRFVLRAPARTTEELLAAVTAAGGSLAARGQLIGGVLAQCDLVKFARRQPAPATAPGTLRQARTFVEQTAEQLGANLSRYESLSLRDGPSSLPIHRPSQTSRD
jgi:hypothetical protein